MSVCDVCTYVYGCAGVGVGMDVCVCVSVTDGVHFAGIHTPTPAKRGSTE